MKKELSFDDFTKVDEKDWQDKLSAEFQLGKNDRNGKLDKDQEKLLNFISTSELTYVPLYTKTTQTPTYAGFAPYRRGFKVQGEFVQLKYRLRLPFDHDELYQYLPYLPNVLEYDARLSTVNDIELACRNLHLFLRKTHSHECEYWIRLSEISLATALLESLGNYSNVKIILDLSKIFFYRTENSLDLDYNLDLFQWTKRCSKLGLKLLFSGSHYDQIGAHSSMQNALTISFFSEIFDMLSARGMSQKEILEIIEFELALPEKTFEAVGQVRSFREMLYYTFVAKQLACEDFYFPIHITCSHKGLTSIDFWQNILRSSSVVMSACMVNVSSVTPVPMDKAMSEQLKCSSEVPQNVDAIAINTYHVLIRESHLAQVIDPAGGSFFIEDLTSQISQLTFEKLQTISKQKTFYDYIKSEEFKSFINVQVERNRSLIYKKKKIIAGVNEYPRNFEDITNELSSANREVSYPNGDSEASKLFVMKMRDAWDKDEVKFDEQDWRNLLIMFSDGMCLRQVQSMLNSHAEFQFYTTFDLVYLAQPFEDLRNELRVELQNQNAKAFIYVAGDRDLLQARINFVENQLLLFGLKSEIITELETYADNNTNLLILCANDDKYTDLVLKTRAKIITAVLYIVGGANFADDDLHKQRLERLNVGMNIWDFGLKLKRRFRIAGQE